MKKIRAALSDEERAEKSAKILSNLTKLEEYKNAELVLTYVSLKFEVDTFAFIETAHNDGKRIAVPRCVEGKPNIDFYYINSIE
ncbi:5-formyltetrahydrofolate cyclo-ligase, partial [Rhodanobacter denitrificans]